MPITKEIESKKIDFSKVNAAALSRFDEFVMQWLPNGEKHGNEWVSLNPTRHDNRLGAFKINLNTGRWGDFSSNDYGGDPISLYAYLFNCRQVEAAKILAQKLGVHHG